MGDCFIFGNSEDSPLHIDPRRASAEAQGNVAVEPVADLIVLSMGGAEVYRFDNLDALVPDETAEVVSLNWSPQGEKLLVALSPGGLVSVPLSGDGEPKLIVAGGVAAQPAQAAWSPTGEEVGFLAQTDDDRSSLFVSGVAATPELPRALLPEEADRHTIFDWAWLPDGRSLIFSEERELTSTADLWRIKSDGSDRELVASAGTVAPVARIVGAKPSRDGRSVAYQVIVPGDAGGVSDAAAQSTAQVMNRYLNRPPSITIREGHRVKVYVTNDFELPPYGAFGAAGGSMLAEAR